MTNQTNLLRMRDVTARTGLSRATIYRKMNAGTFPNPHRIDGKAIRWFDSEIEDWIQGLPVCQDRHKAA